MLRIAFISTFVYHFF